MAIAMIGAGRIGGNCARQSVRAGHEVKVAFSRDRTKLEALAGELGDSASAAEPDEAVGWAELVIFSVGWDSIDDALAAVGSLEGKLVVDTTNQFGSGPM